MPAISEKNSQTLPISEKTCLLWINSCLREESSIKSFNEGVTVAGFVQLINELTGTEILSLTNAGDGSPLENTTENFKRIVEFLQSEDVCSELNTKALAEGHVAETIKALWLICLHFDIHSQKRASYQRTVRLGKRFMLDWISNEINDDSFSENDSFVKCFSDGAALQKLISKYHKEYEANKESESEEILHTVFDAANTKWHIPTDILSPSALVNEMVSEVNLLVYLAILRRKILQENMSSSPAKGPTRETSPKNFKMESPKQRIFFGQNDQFSNAIDASPKEDSPLRDRSFDLKDFLIKLSPKRNTDKHISSNEQDTTHKQQTKANRFSDQEAKSSNETSGKEYDDKTKWKTTIRDFNRNWELEFENNEGFDDMNLSLSQADYELNPTPMSKNESDDLTYGATHFKGREVTLNNSRMLMNNLVENEEIEKSLQNGKVSRVPLLTVQSPTPSCSDASDVESEFDEAVLFGDGGEFEGADEEKYDADTGSYEGSKEMIVDDSESKIIENNETEMREDEDMMDCGEKNEDEEAVTVEKTRGENMAGTVTEEDNDGKDIEIITVVNISNSTAQNATTASYNEHHIISTMESDEQDDTIDCSDHAETSLLTSWSEHQLGQEIMRDRTSNDFITFEAREQSSPVITWGSTKFYQSNSNIDYSAEEIDEDILQTSAASATELRVLLEERINEDLDSSEVTTGLLDDEDENGNNRGFGEDVNLLYTSNGFDRSIEDKRLDDMFDELNYLALLKSCDYEKGRLDAVQGIRLEMEECCDGIPLEKIASVVSERWQQTIDSIIGNKDMKSQESEKKREQLLREMRDELNVLAKENFDLSKMSNDMNSYKMQNELLNKQITGLENYVESLEARIEVLGKENLNLSGRLEMFQDELLTKQMTLDQSRNNYEQQINHLRAAVREANEAKATLQSELKIKEIEMKKLQNEINGIKDESKIDFERLQTDTVSLRAKVTELQQQNEALRIANKADQTIIKHLETKLQNSENLIEEVKTTKREVLVDLQESREREKTLMKGVSVLEKDKNNLGMNNQNFLKEIKVLKDEKSVLEKELNVKISVETKSTEAMLTELKNLEKSLNEVRREKSLVEDKYNNVKCENERLQRNVKVLKLQTESELVRKSQTAKFDAKSETLESLSGTVSPYDSEVESIDSYAGFPDVSFQSPSSLLVKSHKKTPRANEMTILNTAKRGADVNEKIKANENRNQSYSVEDTRSWLRNMETKLQQTDKLLRSVKKSPHLKI